MKLTAFWLVVAMAGAPFAAGQYLSGPQVSTRRDFGLGVKHLDVTGYMPAGEGRWTEEEQAREDRGVLRDSPMDRLMIGVGREMWAMRHPGPVGMVIPNQAMALPVAFRVAPRGELLVLGPWSRQWGELTWQEKVAAGAETGLLAWTLFEAAKHAF